MRRIERPLVFLSYRREDAEGVERIAVRLEQGGVGPWLDTLTLTRPLAEAGRGAR